MSPVIIIGAAALAVIALLVIVLLLWTGETSPMEEVAPTRDDERPDRPR